MWSWIILWISLLTIFGRQTGNFQSVFYFFFYFFVFRNCGKAIAFRRDRKIDICTLFGKNEKCLQEPFLCLSLSQIRDVGQYVEGPNSTWKDQNRNIGVQVYKDMAIVLPGTDTSPPIFGILKHRKRCLEVLSFLDCAEFMALASMCKYSHSVKN